jgi:polar amino acid transport system substrate-binding protein
MAWARGVAAMVVGVATLVYGLPPLRLAHAETIRIAAMERWPPYSSPELPNNGFSTQIVQTAFERAGYATEVVVVPWSRGFNGVMNGAFDALPNTWYRTSRLDRIYYTNPHGKTKTVFASRKSDAFYFQDISDINDKTIALIQDYNYPDYISENQAITEVRTTSLRASLRMLAAGRVDLALGDQVAMKFQLRNNLTDFKSDIRIGQQSVKTEPIYVAISKKTANHREIAKAFNRQLEAMKASGAYDRIMAEHGYPTYMSIRR